MAKTRDPKDKKLLDAVKAGDAAEVDQLLKEGADPNAKFRKRSALDLVPHNGHQVKCLLIEAGARSPDLKNALVWAASQSRPATVKALIEFGADINMRAPMGTPLVVAVSVGCLESVSLLLEAGCDRGAASGFSTPLTKAIEGERLDLLKLLLDKGVNPRQRPEHGGLPPLFTAVLAGQKESVVALLEAGADPCETATVVSGTYLSDDVERYNEIPPLHLAAAQGKANCLASLLEAGADPNARDGRGFTAFDWAREKNFSLVAEALAKAGALELESEPQEVLFGACDEGDLEGLKRALDGGAQLEGRDQRTATKNFTPLLVAAYRNQTEACRFLVERGAELDVRDDSPKIPSFLIGESDWEELSQMGYLPNRSPLLWALAQGNQELALFFVERGAPVEDKDHLGETPMMAAAKLDSPTLLAALVEAGGKPDKAGRRRTTPLMAACESGCLEAARWLLDHKAKPDRKNSDGQPPLSLACSQARGDVVRLLLERGADVNLLDKLAQTPLVALVGALRIVPYKKGDPSIGSISFGASGATTLAPYPEDEILEILEVLLAAGASVNPKGVTNTPLYNAAQANQPRVISRLLEAGANPRTQGMQGYTALALAELYQYKEAIEVLRGVTPKTSKKKKKQPEPVSQARMTPVPDLTTSQETPEFQAACQQLSELCGSQTVSHQGWVECHVDTSLQDALTTGEVQERFRDLGFFLVERSGSVGPPQKFALFPSGDWRDALALFQTNGINCDVGTQDIIDWLAGLQETNPFQLLTVSHDLVGGRFLGTVRKPAALAKSMYRICPDCVDQGFETVQELAASLKKDPTFFLWWD